jgi:CBS domain-containing protein
VKIRSAFPRLLEKRYPYVEPTFPLLTVLNLLRANHIAAVPLHEGLTSSRSVSGFSSLSKLMRMSSESFEGFLEGPCERGSKKVDSFGLDDDLEKLLEVFKKRRVAVSMVNGVVEGEPRFGLISLKDLLGLYKTGQFTSDLAVEDVSSQIFSLPGTTTVREALTAMFRLYHRSVFISGERKYISDRTIIDRVFDPSFLRPFHQSPTVGVFDARIGTLERTTPTQIGPLTSLKAAALRVRSEWGTCLTLRNRDTLVTPWDLIMKPWESGNLSIRERP